MYLIILTVQRNSGQKIWWEFDDAIDFLDQFDFFKNGFYLKYVVFNGKLIEITDWQKLYKKING